MTEKTKNIVVVGLELLMALLAVVSLAFCIVRINYTTNIVRTGFSTLTFGHDFSSQKYFWTDYLFGGINIAIVLVSALAFVFGGKFLLAELDSKVKAQKRHKALDVMVGFLWGCSAVYMLEGMFAKMICHQSYVYSSGMDLSIIYFHSDAYIAFVLMSVLALAYILVCKYTTKQSEDSNKQQLERVHLLKEYKELLDCGAITQEEYDKKKNELL